MSLSIKRVYDPPDASDGTRVLVDRLWPRGLSKETAKVDRWQKDLAPSDELRRWFGHNSARWPEFRKRYASALRTSGELITALVAVARRGRVTLLYAARDEQHNNAVMLLGVLRRRSCAERQEAAAPGRRRMA